MNGFREDLYRGYVSRFRKNYLSRTDQARWSYTAWAERKYLPLLRGLSKDAPILELGCGPAYFLEFLRARGFSNAVGIDASSEQISLALTRGLVVQQADVFQFFNENRKTYDAIVALDFLEHFARDELSELIPMVFRSLNPGGRLIISTPNGQGLFAGEVIFGDLTHMTIFTPSSLAQLLTAHDFSEVQCRETGPVAKNVAGFIRVAFWGGVRFMAKASRFVQTGKRQDIWTETFLCLAYREDRPHGVSPDGSTNQAQNTDGDRRIP